MSSTSTAHQCQDVSDSVSKGKKSPATEEMITPHVCKKEESGGFNDTDMHNQSNGGILVKKNRAQIAAYLKNFAK